MIIATLYTLYGRRAGAELCFEKTISSVHSLYSDVKWIILCNTSAKEIIEREMPFAKAIYISYLDNQYKKAFWLEFLAGVFVDKLNADCFWIPSGCNHFPGRWKIPTLTTFHDLGEYHVANKYSKARMIFRKKICIPRNLKRGDSFTAVSRFTKDDMVKYLGLKDEMIRVVYNGVSPHESTVPHNSIEIIKKIGLKDGEYYFIPGRTDYIGKGLDILLSAYSVFRERHPEIKLVLVGPEGEGHYLLTRALEKKCNKDSVFYLGRVNDDTLVSLYSHCASTIISSRFEGFGFPVLEAMQYGVPIICSDAGALKEIAGEAALIFESGNVNQLVNQMETIYSASKGYISDLKRKGAYRLKSFSWNKCAQEMYEEFSALTVGALSSDNIS